MISLGRIQSVVLFLLLLSWGAGCATPGVPAGDAQKGYIVWGFVGQGTTTAATGQNIALVAASGQTVQTATTDGTGKYVFAYHQPGQYVVQVGQHAMQVVIASADQRLDIDLSNPTGTMNYAAGAAKSMAADGQGCGTAAPAVAPAAAPGAANGQPATAEQRDPALEGRWTRQDSITSGDAFMSTKLTLLVCADGGYVRSTGDTVGGGDGWHAESGGGDGGNATRGRWRTEGGVVYVDDGMGGWSPYARYYVEGNQLMFTFSNGKREVWSR